MEQRFQECQTEYRTVLGTDRLCSRTKAILTVRWVAQDGHCATPSPNL